MAPRNQCLSDTAGLRHIRTHRDCNLTHKTCTGSSLTGVSAGGGEQAHIPTPKPKAICDRHPLAKENSVPSNGVSLSILDTKT